MAFMLKEVIERRELLYNLTSRNLKIRYKNSFFGFFWTLLNPLFMILVYMVFIGLMRFPMDLPYLICGVIPWHFLTMCIGDSINVIEGNSSLIKKTSFPRVILPLSTLSADTVNFLLSLIVVLALVPVASFISSPAKAYSFNLIYVFPAFFLQLMLVFGLSLLFSTLNVYFKDTEHIVNVFLMAWFFMTPIIYPLSMIDNFKRSTISLFKLMLLEFYYLNPMVLILSFYRKAFLNTDLPLNYFSLISIVIIFLIFVLGYLFFKSKSPYFADEM